MTDHVDSKTELQVDYLKSTNGTAHVTQGYVSQPKNRNRSSITTREKAIWAAGAKPNEVWLLALDTSVTASEANAAIAICWDATNDAQADTWLTETDSEVYDVEYDTIPLGVWVGPFYFPSTANYEGLTRADFKAIGAETLRLMIRGV